VVHDPDDVQTVAHDALDMIDLLLLEVPEWDRLPAATQSYMALVTRYEALCGCVECGLHDGHKLDCSHAR
jgi:hypothetical protein